MMNRGVVKAIQPGRWFYTGTFAAILVLLALSCLYTLLRSLKWPIVHDVAIQHYVAWRILSGTVPYKELFEPNFPGSYLIHMAIQKFLGCGDLQWQIFNILYIFFSAVAISVFCRPYGTIASIVPPFLYAAVYLAQGAFDQAQKDFLMVPLVMLSAHFLAVSLEKSRNGTLAFSGLLLGMSFTLKPFIVLLFVLYLAAFIAYRFKDRRAALGGSLLFLGSAALPVLLTAYWLFSLGALRSFIEIVTRYLMPLYGRLEHQGPVYFTLYLLAQLLPVSPVLVLLPLLKGGTFIRKPRNVVMLIGAFYGILQFVLQGKGFYYHLYPFYGFLFAFVGMLLAELMHDDQPRVKTMAVIGFFFMVSCFSVRCFEAGKKDMSMEKIKPLVPKLVRAIKAFPVSGNDTVQVLDTTEGAVQALFRLRIKQPTRFINDYQFFHDIKNPYIQKLRAEFVRDLEIRSPKLIVVANYSWIPPNTIGRLHLFPEFEKLLDLNYTVYKVEKEFTIYANRRYSTGIVR